MAKLNSTSRGHIVAIVGEFLGTFLFLFFAFSGTQVANTRPPTLLPPSSRQLEEADKLAPLLYISLAFGFSLLVNGWIFAGVSGSLFNPAVTFGMCLIGALSWVRGLLVVSSQIIAAIAAAAVVHGLFPGPLVVQTSLSPGTSIVRGLFIETFLTAELMLAIFMLGVEKHDGTFLAPIGIGLALFIAELAGVNYTGGSLNPARSFGPDLILWQWEGYHWIYWLGPIMGATLAAGSYKLVKKLQDVTEATGPEDHGRDVERTPLSHA